MEDYICIKMRYKKCYFPCKYLGIHLEKGARKNKGWGNILYRIDKQTETWKAQWLTKAGRAMKIKAIFSYIPTYQMLCLPLPKNINKKLEGKLRNFFQNETKDKKRLALIKWEKICQPKEVGGLGIKKFSQQNEVLGGKLVWRMYKERESKWAKILYNKYSNAKDTT